MKKLLNTLFILSDDVYLSLDGETVKVTYPDGTHKSVPSHILESIVSFSYKGASPALMGECSEKGIQLSFYSPKGAFLASVANTTKGNVYLRREQYRLADQDAEKLSISKNLIIGKLYNEKYVLLRCARDHGLRVDEEKLRNAAGNITRYMKDAGKTTDINSLRGIEGNAAAEYFQVFDEMILQNEEAFRFSGRNRRPPVDRTNALLSLAYSLLANDCGAALYGAGLDPYVGFMHVDRPGRKSLALDLEEELRSNYADRFVLTLINNRIILPGDFIEKDNGAVFLTDDGRKKFFSEWQKRKKTVINHPFLNEKMEWGLVPHVQAMLLARFIRGDLEQYPPFFWK